MKKRLLSLLTSLALAAGVLPTSAVTALGAGLASSLAQAETIENEYISASVSKENGGFTVTTAEGDRLNKSDNDKHLLYHDGRYDTSFLSFRVGDEADHTDYLFGGSYPAAGSTAVTVTKNTAGDGITAIWGLETLGLTFTQSISLVSETANEHGMVSIAVTVENSGNRTYPVQARLLLDTCLGSQDHGYYQYADVTDHSRHTVSQECILTAVPSQIYAVDDPYSPGVMAYTVHTGTTPTKAAFGHWSHLGATLFDFDPVITLDFTSSNSEYMTADSAYALYYDLGSVFPGSDSSLSTYYGVYSHRDTPAGDSVSVDVTAPIRLELSDSAADFQKLPGAPGQAHFTISATFTNIQQENARDLSNLVLAVRSGSNLRSLDDTGEPMNGQDFDSTTPATIPYENVLVGESRTKVLNFQARLTEEASYERIILGVYDVSETGGQLSDTYKLGETTAYILLPGTDNGVPKVNFAAMTPKIIHTDGTRHLFVTVGNETMLSNPGHWDLKVYDENNDRSFAVPHANISIKEGVMDVALTEDLSMQTGAWYLQLEWTDAAVAAGLVTKDKQLQSAPELHFTVSADPKYKNDSYGVLAVIEQDIAKSSFKNYVIRSFLDEESFDAFKEMFDQEIIFTFKGNFTATKKNGTEVVGFTAVSTKTTETDGTSSVSNSILINDCLDFEEGTLSVYLDNDFTDLAGTGATSAVCVEFDGKLYTNKARTAVWSGKGMFTPLKNGVANYGHLVYDEDGNRGYLHTEDGVTKFEDDATGFTETPIYLVWPTTGEIGQTISGMLFDFTYGVLGTMYDTDGYGIAEEVIGDVISFSAMLDLTFLQGKVDENAAEPNTYWNKMKDVWLNSDQFNTVDFCAYDMWLRTKATAEADYSDVEEGGENKNEKKASGSVLVHDVIFGCGEGFVGINFEVGVAIKNYISGLPNIEGTIKINTINNWSYGVDGKFDLEVFTVEASVSIKSRNNIPVPDELYVFVSFSDAIGINIDGLGFLWITGGGGGIKNLYDSIFSTKAVPPLKLLLSVSFEILKVMECEKATLSLGLTGISLTAENIGVKAVPGLTAIQKMGLSFEWYPGIDLRANIVVNLMNGIIYGGGYVVLISPDYKDVFFEMFARAQVRVPASIPVVGGVTLAGVDLGISTEKIWGALEILFITLGITYYWGEGSVDFGSGSKTHPTFPDLLGYDDIPVAYDAETDQTLYLRVGTNTQLIASSLPDDGGLKLMNSTGAYVKSDRTDKSRHQFNLGTYSTENDAAIVQITFNASSADDAEEKANEITVGTASDYNKNDYGLVLYNGTNLESANANLTFDENTKKATYAFTATDSAKYGTDWYLTTPKGSEVLLYNVVQVPEVSSVSGTVNSNSIDLTWTGTDLAELDQVSFYLTDSTTATDPGYRLGVVTENPEAGSISLPIPADVPTGEYYLRAVYSKSDEVNGVVFSENKVSWENTNTPGTVTFTEPKPVGNLQYELTLSSDNTDGYLVTVYNTDGTATDFEQVSYEKAESDSTVIRVGGSYTSTVQNENGQNTEQTFGLKGGKTYYIGVTPYKTVKTSINGNEGQIAVHGKEIFTDPIPLPEMKTPTVTFSADQTPQTRTEITYRRVLQRNEETGTYEYAKDENGNFVTQKVDGSEREETVYTSNTLTITADIDEPVTGTWTLDSGGAGQTGDFTDQQSVEINLTNLAEGGHTLTVEGAAADGDSFTASYVFTVDTLPPQLLLAAPVNGSFFQKDGKITFSGTTDADARFTVSCDGVTLCHGKTVQELGGDFDKSASAFSFQLDLPDPDRSSQRELTLSVQDDVGNATTPQTVTVSHGGLADLKELTVSVDGLVYPSGNVPIPASGLNGVPISLVGVTSSGTKFAITGDNVTWEVLPVEGSAQVDGDIFTVQAMSRGILTGKLAVANGAFRTATLCFGAPADHFVAVSSTLGGSVTGGGEYTPGAAVTLTATPDSGYRFAGWTITGVTAADITAPTVTFLMPDEGNVTAVARFESLSNGSDRDDDSVYARAGEIVRVRLPAGKSETDYLPCLTTGNDTVFPPISAVVDGYVTFIAPKTGTYRFKSRSVDFADISGHWAENAIVFCGARNIFNGTGNGQFEPDSSMTRSMFATVLYRLAGSPAVSGSASFSDVEEGAWYSDAIFWGQSTGILSGYEDGRFGVNDLITREQMCVLLTRYLRWAGYDLPSLTESAAFADSALIADWAAEGVAFCQRTGLINGKPNNRFAPQDYATRGENCTVFQRMILAILTTPKETSGSSPIRVGFLDSGISTRHLNAVQVEAGENFVFPDRDTTDRLGHGTATAGLVLGSEELGLSGLCPGAVAIPLVCYDLSPTGLTSRCDGEELAKAIYAGVDDYHCDILNISMGMTEDDPALRQAVEYALSKGVLVISAVGNDNLTAPERVYYPAAYEGVIGVGSADGDAPADFSQQNGVDVLAQGVALQTVTHRNAATAVERSGTSYSCAIVSGICAHIWQTEPDLTAQQVTQRLFLRAKDIGPAGFDRDSGWGILETD